MSKEEKPKSSKKYKFPDVKSDKEDSLEETTKVRPTRIKKA